MPPLVPERDRSLAGYIAHTRQPRLLKNGDVRLVYEGIRGQIQSALGAPVLAGETLLGVITLLHPDLEAYTAEHERYLVELASAIASPLQGFLARENARPLQSRPAFQQALSLGTDDLLATDGGAHAVARQVALALGSDLCTIWLATPSGRLLWGGLYDANASTPPALSPQSTAAIQAAFGVALDVWTPGQAADRQARVRDVVDTKTLRNYGYNRDPTFSQGNHPRPFLLTALVTHAGQLLGVIHVGLKRSTPDNPDGLYWAADEVVLDSLQQEIVVLYERQQAQGALKHATDEIHGAVGFYISAVSVNDLGAVRQALQRGELAYAEALLRGVEQTLGKLQERTDTLIKNLASYTLEGQGLVAILRDEIETKKRTARGITWHLKAQGESGYLPSRLVGVLRYVAQEAFTNAIRHGHATEIWCDVSISAQAVTLCIRDNGQGFTPDSEPRAAGQPLRTGPGGYGLRHIQASVEEIGGTFTLESTPGPAPEQGTTITVFVPRRGLANMPRRPEPSEGC